MAIERKYLYLSLIPFLVTAFFSEGFYHPDEHYVILEFLQTKISSYTKPEIFNWDFHERIRPWFQTFVYYLLYLIQPFKNPFYVATIIRIFNALLGWLALRELLKFYFKDDGYEKKLLIYSLVWFVPFIFARTSGESLSASLFILGSVNLLKNKAFPSGLLYGLSFLVRYQMGVAIMAASLWHLFSKRDFKFFSLNALGILIFMALGPLFDLWGYGEWAYSPFNYLYTNLVENRSANFGVSPFWYYLSKPVVKGGGPIGLYFLIALLLFLKTEIKSIWAAIIIFFVFIHSLIPHKEVRFISIVYVLLPLIVYLMMEKVKWLKNKKLLIFLGTINFLIMIKSSFFPAEGMLGIYKHVHSSDQKSYFTKSDVNGNYFKFTMPFYEVVPTTTKPYKSMDEFINQGSVFFVTSKYNEYKEFKNRGCQNRFAAYPEFVLEKMNFFGWVDRSAVMATWECMFDK